MKADTLILVAMLICGAFTSALGVVHIFMPRLFDFRNAIPGTGEPLSPLRLGPIHYTTTRADVYGIAWVMNHAASYVLISIGIADLLWWRWPDGAAGALLPLWIAGWWLLRAASQLYLGRRRGDRKIMLGFSVLAAVHLLAAVAR
ncbi:MAG: hypothetical protein QOF73_5230 [Thermomicrobiales bacterium]|jgi:hypothetical protein|nr:hypothetical protein [Thermomicrobiales bacterium]